MEEGEGRNQARGSSTVDLAKILAIIWVHCPLVSFSLFVICHFM